MKAVGRVESLCCKEILVVGEKLTKDDGLSIFLCSFMERQRSRRLARAPIIVIYPVC